MIQIILAIFLLQVAQSSFVTQNKDLSLTIYNDNFAMVKDSRNIFFDNQSSYLSFDDVAATIEAYTVTFRPKNKSNQISIMEQNFENNLVDKIGVLKKYLKKEITVYAKLADSKIVRVTGKLMSYQSSLILQNQVGLQIYDEIQGVILPQLPEGLLTLPALVWKVDNHMDKPLQTQCQIAYKATGFSWKADYILILNQQETLMDFSGWVTIINKSGKKYKDARIKLIAGEVNTVRKPFQYSQIAMDDLESASNEESKEITEKSFGDYHMYTINRKVDLNESSTKQIQFIPLVAQSKIKKYYKIVIKIGGYQQKNLKAQNMIKFYNSKNNKMGVPLPKGVMRIYKQDQQDKQLQFLGQDSINHTPKNQYIKVKIGNAFDLSVKKLIHSRTNQSSGNWKASVGLQIINHGIKTSIVVVELQNSYDDNIKVEWGQPQELVKQSTDRYNVTIKVSGNKKRLLHWEQKYTSDI